MKMQTAQSAQRSVRELMIAGERMLDAAGVDNARLEAGALLRHVMELDKAEWYLTLDTPAHPECEALFLRVLLRRARREPFAYITGRKEFWSLDFTVTPEVLIPRPETELLVEVALKGVIERRQHQPPRILDLGTGSGVIAVCLARELPSAEIAAIDISPAALEVARTNCKRHGVDNRIRLVAGDLCRPLRVDGIKFDLIIANPPYIKTAELRHVMKEIRDWEPRGALNGGSDGLDYYRRIVPDSVQHLVAGGRLVLEIGDGMGPSVIQLIEQSRSYGMASVHRDFSARERVVVAEVIAPQE